MKLKELIFPIENATSEDTKAVEPYLEKDCVIAYYEIAIPMVGSNKSSSRNINRSVFIKTKKGYMVLDTWDGGIFTKGGKTNFWRSKSLKLVLEYVFSGFTVGKLHILDEDEWKRLVTPYML